jgi:NAD(P)-dependent dehydrogenase (short-subunit alcohol dehydrogenase family)
MLRRVKVRLITFAIALTQETTPMFTAEDVPSQDGKIFVITGGNSGIGFEVAKVLVRKGARLVLACRDEKKMAAGAAQLRALQAGAVVDELVLDLASLASIEQAAQQLAAKVPRVDVLLNNAGVMALPSRVTADGFEMQFGTNHLGHFAFTGRVLPLVLAAPAGRVVTQSSLLHRGGHIAFDDLPTPKVYDEGKQYSMSKLANVLFSYELDRRLKKAGTRAIALACHPGYSATNLQGVGPQMKGSAFMGLVMKLANAVVAQPAAMGALGALMASTGEMAGGEYIGPTGFNAMRGPPVKARSNDESYDEGVAKRLWEVSEQLTRVTFAFPGAVAA